MKHLRTFERFWENPIGSSKKLTDVNDIWGVFDDGDKFIMPDKNQLDSEKDKVAELLKIKDVLKAAGIDSEIEILHENAKDKVGQYHILTFEYDNDKLYSTGWEFDRCISVYHYGHTSRCEYEIPLGTEDYTTYVKDIKDKYQDFHDWTVDPPEEDESYMAHI